MKRRISHSYIENIRIEKTGIWVVAFAWLSINLGLYWLYGIQTGLESKKYINEANLFFETGHVSEFRYYFYFGIIGLLYITKLIGFGIKSAIGIQLIISLCAHLYLYKSLLTYTTSKISITAIVLIILAPSFEYWNWTLYSESIFFSAIMIFIGACIRRTPTELKIITSQGLILVFCILSRPSGILLAIPWILFVIQTNVNKWSWRIAGLSLFTGTVALIAVSNAILGTIGDWNVMDPYKKGYVICNISVYSTDRNYLLEATSPIGQLIEFVLKYPSEFISLTVDKFIAFFLQYRSYYSPLHNGYVIFYSLITLGLFTRRTFYEFKISPITTMFYLSITLWTISIILQCDDYHSRFYSAIVPFIVLAGINQTSRSNSKS